MSVKSGFDVHVGGKVTAEQDKEIQTLLFRRVDPSNLPKSGPLITKGSYPARGDANNIISRLVVLKVPFDAWVKGKDSDIGSTTPDQKIVFRPDLDSPIRSYCDAEGQPIGPENEKTVGLVRRMYGDLPDYSADKLEYDDSDLTYEEMHDRLLNHQREDEFYGHESPRNDDSRFRLNLYHVLEIEDNPKRHKLFEKAWQEGHSEGLYSVLGTAADLVELITED